MQKGIAAIGNLIVDVIKEINAYPEAGNLSTITGVSRTTGGLAANCLLALAKLDPAVPLEAVGMVGADEYGDTVRRALAEAGIDTRFIRRHPTLGTSFTDVMNEGGGGERTFFHYRGANAALGPDDVPLGQIRAEILHFGYILLLDAMDAPDPDYGTAMARTLAKAKEMGYKTSVDVVSEQGERFQKLVPPSLRYIDYCVINEVEASLSTGIRCRDDDGKLIHDNMPALCRALRAMGVRAWVVIHCPEGCFALDEQDRYLSQPSLALPPEAIQGKTGAGDAFCACVLYGAHKGMPLPETLRLANAAAASCLMEKGATEGIMPVTALPRLIDRYGFRTWGGREACACKPL